MLYQVILPSWAIAKYPDRRRVLEGEFSDERVRELNTDFYNIYFLPNTPSELPQGRPVDGSDIDTFNFVFVDFDLKSGTYESKEAFISALKENEGLAPTFVVDSGNGIHSYWAVSDLDAMSFLRLSRRLMRLFKTDEAVSKIYQLMRVPGTVNTKKEEDLKLCETLIDGGPTYTCEELDRLFPPITLDDEQYCQQHYDKTYNVERKNVNISDSIPLKFAKLLASSKEVKEIWNGNTDDRSKADYRLGHLMFANGFTKDEATAVLVNSAKAISRAPIHRLSYAQNIVDKIWTFENTDAEEKPPEELSQSVKDILRANPGESIKGTRFPCEDWIDNTAKGFRLGQVIGLVAGAGVGKTAMALNMFKGWVRLNPNYHHFFVTLEQPANEIAERWKTMCGNDTQLYEKVQIISNYNSDGSYRNLSLNEIRQYLLDWQKKTDKKVGCVVIDHIGILKMEGGNGENQRIVDICHQMKSFAVETNTLLVMQSQAPREKAGIGDLELNKDAAYGTVFFESYCDYLLALWQPLKRCYSNTGCPTVMAFKFCKIRHKKRNHDIIQEDVNYRMYFDSDTETLRPMTQDEDKSFDWFLKQATDKRSQDRKTALIPYQSTRWEENAETNSGGNNTTAQDTG